MADAASLLDYFLQLGITDLYASPILVSRTGSGHGYDVTDPTGIDPEIGSEEEFEALQSELVKRGMGLLLDIVPNHMAASSENPWWMDVLESGPDSAFAAYFDVDWQPPSRNLTGKVLLPFLARPLGEVLDQGELQLTFQGGKFFIRYSDSLFPIAPESYHQVLSLGYEALQTRLGRRTPALQELAGILAGLAALAHKAQTISAWERRLKFDALRERLRILASDHPEIGAFINSCVKAFNGEPGDPASFSLLERLLGEQHYLLSYWQDPNEGINYRRFFAISDLVGVRVEDPIVFEAMHAHILRLLSKGLKQGLRIGLRIDHIDGLRDPSGYLARLRQSVAEVTPPGAPTAYVVVEKVLARGEPLPDNWPVAGTTGYDFLNYVQGPFVHPEGFRRLEEIYRQFVGRGQDFSSVVYEKKKLVMNSLLRVEMQALARQLAELAAKDRYARNIPRFRLTEALTEITACMPVYRTYIRSLEVPLIAREVIDEALTVAKSRRPHLDQSAVDFLHEVLTLAKPPHIGAGQREEVLTFVMRWQQLTGPIVAKGLEDTALYVYYPLSSMNEVGGNPGPVRPISREEFYEFLTERNRRWPSTLNATTTHDTKRSEDLRARLNVLSEIPEEWSARISSWTKENTARKQVIDTLCVPDANEEYLLYQTILGMWSRKLEDMPRVIQRLKDYIVKALREATIHTRWIKPNEAHESAVTQFIDRILSFEHAPGFLRDVTEFHRRIAWCGMINSLSQVLLKIVSPGTPDFFQGSELWDLRLVDPDNRGPVNFIERCTQLRALSGHANPEVVLDLLRRWPDGQIKLYVTQRSLGYRLQHPDLFAAGEFVPVLAQGLRGENVISALRQNGDDQALAVVPRWLAQAYIPDERLPSVDFWGETELLLPASAPALWTNVMTGTQTGIHGSSKLLVAEVLRDFPVALLVPLT